MASGRLRYRTCALCGVQKHPDDTNLFPAGKLRAQPTRVCWACIETMVEHFREDDEFSLLQLRRKLA